MNGFILLIWIVIIVLSMVKRASQRGDGQRRPASGTVTASPAGYNTTPSRTTVNKAQPASDMAGTGRRKPERLKRYKQADDISCETQYGHNHPERGGGMRFTGRPDLEPGYMYLNGVKVLIKEADRLEFLR